MAQNDCPESLTVLAHQALEDEALSLPQRSLDFLAEPRHFQTFARYVLPLAEARGIDPSQLLDAVLALGPMSGEQRGECKRYLNGAFKQLQALPGETAAYRANQIIPRELALRLCFVLDLAEEQARDFLRKACATHPFHVRSPYEAACWYAVRHRRPYAVVLDLMDRYRAAPEPPQAPSGFLPTQALQTALTASHWESDDDFLQRFLLPNKPSFTGGSRATAQTYRELRFNLCQQIIEWRVQLAEEHLGGASPEQDEVFTSLKKEVRALEAQDPALSGSAKALTDWTQAKKVLENIERYLYRSLPSQEAELRYEALVDGAVPSSQLTKEVLYCTEAPSSSPSYRPGRSILANTAFMNAFPRSQYLTAYQRDPDAMARSPKIRKLIVLLFFMNEYYDSLSDTDHIRLSSAYRTPAGKRYSQRQYEHFRRKLDDLLETCGLPPLYDADPFDWLILKSAWSFTRPELTDDPIQYFNDVVRLSFPQETD